MERFEVGVLFDGNGTVVEDAAVVIRDGVIESAGRRVEVPAVPGEVLHRQPRMTMIPGMIDMHVHLAYSGTPDKRVFRAETADMSYSRLALRAATYARASLEAGFTGLRDCHAPGGVAVDLSAAIAQGHVVGPRIAACGMGLSSTGGHMDPPGWGDHASFKDFTEPCDGPDGYRLGVRRQLKRGAHYIKINACHSRPEGKADHADSRFRSEMTDAELYAVMDEAHMHGRKVAAHAPGGSAIRSAVLAGVDSIEHGHWIDNATLDLMAELDVAYVPTLTVNERNFDFTTEELGASAASWDWLLWSRDVKWDTLERARERKVLVLAGTDAGYMLEHGSSHAFELSLLVKGGYTPAEALTAATRDAAAWLDWDDAGTIEPGKRADFVLVDGDPLADISVLSETAALRVYLRGEEVTRLQSHADSVVRAALSRGKS